MRFCSIFLVLMGCVQGTVAQAQTSISENDYFDDMPVVLSVSRLSQRLDETPGAVTLIDRDFIRRSGARDVADLLRLVPGFQSSSSFEADAPQASYHGVFGNYSARIQVLVDGRSVYSTYFFGSVAPGLMSVPIDDIERIEVLRGSNSASYGARAMLAVVNIVTRHTDDTLGPNFAITLGENGVRDTQVGLGWRTQNAGMHLSLDERGDDGLQGSNGHNQVRRLNFRSDWRLSSSSDVTFRVGTTHMLAGRGVLNNVDRPLRDGEYDADYLQVDWKEVLSGDMDVAFMYAHNQEIYQDVAPYAPIPGVLLDVSGKASNDSLTVQHTLRARPDLQVVWGAELRRESVTSAPLFFTQDALITQFTRLFTNAEWHIQPQWILNAGVMTEHSSSFGNSLAPRVMLNWRVTPQDTLRAGVGKSFRPPSTLEQHADVRYYLNGQLLAVTLRARGGAQPEEVLTRELGYLRDFSQWRSKLDIRVFDEAVTGLIQRQSYSLPTNFSLLPSSPIDYVNFDNFSIRGVELQLQAQPWEGARLGASYVRSRVYSDQLAGHLELGRIVPSEAGTLFMSQQLPQGWQLSLTHQNSRGAGLPQSDIVSFPFSRTDWRVSKTLRFGQQSGELALTVQNQGARYADFSKDFFFERRAFISLRINH
jgi:iron complex outermembrane receptor protein